MGEMRPFEMCEECGRPVCTAGCRRYGSLDCRLSLYELGKCLLDEREYVLAITYLERAADRRIPDAYRLIADCYRLGRGVAVDCEKARQYYQLALCQPSFYEPMLAEAEREKSIKGIVQPIGRIAPGEVADYDDSTQLRYVEVNGTVCQVETWTEGLVELVRWIGERDPEGLLDFASKEHGGAMTVLESEDQSRPERRVEINGEMPEKVARRCIEELHDRFDWLGQSVGLWIVAEPILFPLRVKPAVNTVRQGKCTRKDQVFKGRHAKRVDGRSGVSGGRSWSSLSASVSLVEERETYAQKNIGYLARDNGRFGSLPTYDNMDE